jgi:CRP-like cAMP-binding protein
MARAGSTTLVSSLPAGRRAKVGRRPSQPRERCLEAVIRNPGATAAEIAGAICMGRYAPSRRLPELRAAGLVTNGRSRICRVTQRLSLTWFPTNRQEAQT